MPEHWVPVIVEAIEAGLDVATGLHVRLADTPAIRDAAARHGRNLFDVRHTSQRFATGKGTKRAGLRLLTVGTDCSVGKKYTVLALEKAMRARGFDADFRATGQTGVFISGRGVAIDAVVAISSRARWSGFRPTRTSGIGTSSRARAPSSTPPSPACRSGCCTGRSRTPSWSATSPPALLCAA
jgi:hypothetical protein